MSKIEVNAIEPQCGTTLTVGASGDTITFPTGTTIVNNGTQTGFGRTGTVDWDTTPKTATVTAANGVGYFVDSTSGSITVNLPAGTAGNIVAVSDYAGTAATNNILISSNGSEKIQSGTEDARIYENRDSITLVYVDATQGWLPVNNNEKSAVLSPAFVTATGGTPTTSPCGDYKIHTFTGPGTFTVTCAGNPVGSNTVDYLVAAGGGGGGAGSSSSSSGGAGGGAGGFRYSSSTYCSPTCAPGHPLRNLTGITVTASPYPIAVGGGGAGAAADPPGSPVAINGNVSTFSTVTSAGGGKGGSRNPSSGPNQLGGDGGSGGGTICGVVGSGNTPPTTPSQGQSGGNGVLGGGGGGAMAAGTTSPDNAPTNPGNPGGIGAGIPNAFGTSGQSSGGFYYFSGGGAGGSRPNSPISPGGTGGTGGGGNGGAGSGGASDPGVNGVPGTAGTGNTGGGGGSGGGGSASYGLNAGTGAAGGSGIVIIRYKFQ